jgi:hypothetical protein
MGESATLLLSLLKKKKKKIRFKNLKLKKKINILISQNGAFWDLLTAVTKV